MTRTFFILPLLLPLAAAAQQPLILLDPARGGADSGARITNGVQEKQVTLDLADRLASLLRARGFTVQLTRETDADLSSDARAALANNTHPLACILLYAAPSGSGVHLYTSALKQKDAAGAAVHWDEAQAPYADRSRTLAADLRATMDHGRVTASVGQTWLRPLDNMQCPAVAVELLPEKNGTDADNSSYQSHVANAVANTLLQWRTKVTAATPPSQPAASSVPQPSPQPAAPKGDSAVQPAAVPHGSPAASKAANAPASPAAAKASTPAASPAAIKPPATAGSPAAARPSAASTTSPSATGEVTPHRAPPPKVTPAPLLRQPPTAQPATAQPDRTEP